MSKKKKVHKVFFRLGEYQIAKTAIRCVHPIIFSYDRFSDEFNPNDIEVLVDGKEQPWFKRAQVRKTCASLQAGQIPILWSVLLDLKISKLRPITSYQ